MTAAPSLRELVAHVDHFRWRVIQDAFAEATAAYWLARADQFDRAMPRPEDYTGDATMDDVDARQARVAATAEACRYRAEVALLAGEPELREAIDAWPVDVEGATP